MSNKIFDDLERKQKHVKQIIGIFGNGKLLDDSQCSAEFRDFLSKVQVSSLKRYADECQKAGKDFEYRGQALQDIVNEVGRRLNFQVENGRYAGRQNQSNYDGIWELDVEYKLLVEVKTSNIHNISLDKISSYRDELIKAGKLLREQSGILIVVGSVTGDLASQIKGSKHSWDMRYITVSALFKLLEFMEKTSTPGIMKQIEKILIPKEYICLDRIADIVISTAEDFQKQNEDDNIEEDDIEKEVKRIDSDKLREECIDKIQMEKEKEWGKTKFIKKLKTSWIDKDKKINLVCLVSKKHIKNPYYFFAFQEYYKEFLKEAEDSYIALVCASKENILIIPSDDFLKLTDNMHLSSKRTCRMVRICENGEKFSLILKTKKEMDLTQYKI